MDEQADRVARELAAMRARAAAAQPAAALPAHNVTSTEVRTRRLPTVRMHEAYRIADVEAFRERAADALEAWERTGRPAPGGLTPLGVQETQFTTIAFGKGYDERTVDDFLDEIELALHRHHATRPAEGYGD